MLRRMLKWSFINREYFVKNKNKSQIYELNKITKQIIICWFLTQKRIKFEQLSFSFFTKFTNFIIKLVNWIKIFKKFVSTRYVRLLLRNKMYYKIFIQNLNNLNMILFEIKSLRLLKFYQEFLEFCFYFNSDINQISDLKKKYYETFLVRKDNRCFPYLYEKIEINFDGLMKTSTTCFVTGRSRAVLRAFKLSRFKIRELSNLGLFIGITKSSW